MSQTKDILKIDDERPLAQTLFSQVLSISEDTLIPVTITQNQALKVVIDSPNEQCSIQNFNELLETLCSCSNQTQSYHLKVALLFLKKNPQLQKDVKFERLKGLIERSSKQVEQIDKSDQPSLQQVLYFLSLLLQILSEEQIQFQETQELQNFNTILLGSEKTQINTKEIVSVTVCRYIRRLSKSDASIISLKYLNGLQNKTLNSQLKNQLWHDALWSEQTTKSFLERQITNNFAKMIEYKAEIAKQLVLNEVNIKQFAQVSLAGVLKSITISFQDTQILKDVIKKSCIIYSDKDDLYCAPSFNIQQQIEAQTQNSQKIKEIIKNEKNFDQALNEALSEFKKQTSSNEVIVLSQMLTEIKNLPNLLQERQTNNQSHKFMPEKFELLLKLAKIIQALPHLFPQILQEDNFKQFSDWIIDQLSLVVSESGEIPQDFDEIVTQILATLLGTNGSTSYFSFCVQRNLKNLILSKIVNNLLIQSPSVNENNASFNILFTSLKLLQILITEQNDYESNRVLVESDFYYSSIEFIILETPFLKNITQLTVNISNQQDSNSSKDQSLLNECVKIINATCNWIKIKNQTKRDTELLEEGPIDEEVKISEVERKRQTRDAWLDYFGNEDFKDAYNNVLEPPKTLYKNPSLWSDQEQVSQQLLKNLSFSSSQKVQVSKNVSENITKLLNKNVIIEAAFFKRFLKFEVNTLRFVSGEIQEDDPEYQWRIIPVSDNYFQIQSVKNGRNLQTNRYGDMELVEPNNSSESQQFQIEFKENNCELNDVYYFVSRSIGNVIMCYHGRYTPQCENKNRLQWESMRIHFKKTSGSSQLIEYNCISDLLSILQQSENRFLTNMLKENTKDSISGNLKILDLLRQQEFFEFKKDSDVNITSQIEKWLSEHNLVLSKEDFEILITQGKLEIEKQAQEQEKIASGQNQAWRKLFEDVKQLTVKQKFKLFEKEMNLSSVQLLEKQKAIRTEEELVNLNFSFDQYQFALLKLQGQKSNVSGQDYALIESKMAEELNCVESLLKLLSRNIEYQADKTNTVVKNQIDLIGTLNLISNIYSSKDRTFSNRQKILNGISKELIEHFRISSNQQIQGDLKQNEISLVTTLVLTKVFRTFVTQNPKIAYHLFDVFLDDSSNNNYQDNQTNVNAVKVILSMLQDLQNAKISVSNQEPLKAQYTLSQNLQLLLEDIVNEKVIMWVLKHEKQNTQQYSLNPLCSVVNITDLRKPLIDQFSQLLLELSIFNEQNWKLIIDQWKIRFLELQHNIISNIVIKLDELDASFDEEELPDLQYSFVRQSSNAQVVAKNKSVEDRIKESEQKLQTLNSQQLKIIETKLLESEKFQSSLQVIQSLFEKFSKSERKTEVMKNQLEKLTSNHEMIKALNFALQRISNQKELPTNLSLSLVRHINLEFDQIKEEIQKIEEVENQETTGEIKMKPIDQDEQNLKSRLAKFVFQKNVDISEHLFNLSKLCLLNKDFINKMLQQLPQEHTKELKLMTSKMRNVLNFERKREIFLSKLQLTNNRHFDLTIRRDNILNDAFDRIADCPISQLKNKGFRVEFRGEDGYDAGGLTRDFYLQLTKEIFAEKNQLFHLKSSGSTYHPNLYANKKQDYLKYFRFVGRMIGKAILDQQLISAHLSRPLYRMMVGEDLDFNDLMGFDLEAYNTGFKLLKDDVTHWYLTFQSQIDEATPYDLIENGGEVAVTNENKIQYLEKYCLLKMYHSVKAQIDAFLEGFYEMIPKKVVSILTTSELELIICGLPTVDLNDLKQNVIYEGYQADSNQVKWMWQLLESMNQEELGLFLSFVTGCSQVPLGGFANLLGDGEPRKMKFVRINDPTRLPTTHTCFNILDLPAYQTQEEFERKVKLAILNNSGYGFR